MSTELENTTNTDIADDALLATVFDWEHFKKYVNTYDPQKHGNNDAVIIMQDMLYGIGISMQSERYKWFYGYRAFLRHLKVWIKW